MKKVVAVTGCAGFIGSHLVDRLLKEGYEVIGVDNMCTGSYENISEHENFQFFPHDITTPLYIEGRLDYILHFASAASPIDYQRLPIETLKVGSLGTMNCLELARDKGATILVASTSEVYGNPLEHPQNEKYYGNVNPIGERSMYDEAKRFLEAVTMAYHKKEGVDTRIVRIFNTFGERMRVNDGRAIPAFFSQAIKGEPLSIFGDGSQTRSFCYIDDTIEGIYRLMVSDYSYPVNLGNPEEITLNQLADEILEITGSKSLKVHYQLPQDDPLKRKPDISKAKEILGWEPKHDRKESLIKTYHYFKKKLEHELQKKKLLTN